MMNVNEHDHRVDGAAAGSVPGLLPGRRGDAGDAADAADAADAGPDEIAIPVLVGQVFEAAPASERGRLLEQLMRPLGVLSLMAVAGGVFASLRFRGGWQDFHVRLDDAQRVHASDVIALVDHVQQVSIEAVDGLAQTLMASPIMAGSAAAALLVTLLLQRARNRQEHGAAPARLDGH